MGDNYPEDFRSFDNNMRPNARRMLGVLAIYNAGFEVLNITIRHEFEPLYAIVSGVTATGWACMRFIKDPDSYK